MKRSPNKGKKTLEEIKAEHEIITRLARGEQKMKATYLENFPSEKGVCSIINDLFAYDWRERMTPEFAEKELKGFTFKGPGWYLTNTTTLLVVPGGETENKGYYTFYYWSHNLAGEGTNALVNAPTRVDDRS